MPAECAFQRTLLQWQYHRFLAWKQTLALDEDEDEEQINAHLGVSPLLLVATLSEIRTLMEHFAELNGRYVELLPEEEPEEKQNFDGMAMSDEIATISLSYEKPVLNRQHAHGTNHLRKMAAAAKNVAKRPRKLVWAGLEAKGFEKHLLRLRDLNDNLYEMMNDKKLEILKDTTQKIYLGTLQLHQSLNRLENLTLAAVMQAGTYSSQMNPVVAQRQHQVSFVALTEFKCEKQAIEDGMPNSKHQATVARPLLATNSTYLSRTRTDGFYTNNNGTKRYIWVEWKRYTIERTEPNINVEVIPLATMSCMEELVSILSIKKPRDFCTPHCLGYFDDRGNNRDNPARFGLVFEKPSYAQSSDQAVTLRQLLDNEEKPSLTVRVELALTIASCLLYIHAVNWLHKAIRSDNILYFRKNGVLDFADPTISGFDYARPARSGQKTSGSDDIVEWEIYRHPSYQGEYPNRPKAKKTFDIYSMGIVLLEIARWQNIETIMSIQNPEKMSLTVTKDIQTRLLKTEPRHMQTLKADMGQRYHDVVEKCIQGAAGFAIDEKDEETSPITGVRLQQRFMDDVVGVLRSITS